MIKKIHNRINLQPFQDGPHKISKSLIVMFVDVDDTPPVFVNSQCTSTCFTCPVSAINADVHYTDQVIQKIIIFHFKWHLRIPSCGSGFADVTIEAIDIKCFLYWQKCSNNYKQFSEA